MIQEDIKDNAHDEARMQPEITVMDLPDVEDIPGQENIKPAPMGELADVTASSADEEGAGLLDDEEVEEQGLEEDTEEEDDLIADDEDVDDDSDVSDEERELLDEAANTDPAYVEEKRVKLAEVDMTDEDGDPLNEGEELDVPGSELDDDQEEIGDEDEENNEYSTDKNDDDNND